MCLPPPAKVSTAVERRAAAARSARAVFRAGRWLRLTGAIRRVQCSQSSELRSQTVYVRRHGDTDRHLRRDGRVKTPIDIFPTIGIPVVAVVWTYDGLPADDMSKRVIYFTSGRSAPQVNDIEHIESQSLPRYGVVKVFFQPGVNINAALAETTAASQTVLKYLPPGYHAALSFSPSTPPACRSSSWRCRASRSRRRRSSTTARTSSGRSSRHSWFGDSFALWRQDSSGPGGYRSGQAAGLRTVDEGRRRRDRTAEHRDAGWDGKSRRLRVRRQSQRVAEPSRRTE